VTDRTEYLVRCSPVKATAACAARWRDINPYAQASSDDARFLIFHGAADTMVPYTESQALNYYNRRAAMASTLIKVAGGPHGQGIVFGSAARKKQMVDFMRYATR
jgi:predicted esterase